MIDTHRAVYAETNDQVLFKERALEVNMPERTTTNSLVDVTNGWTVLAHWYCTFKPKNNLPKLSPRRK
jgi:hypothetical protein